MNHAIVIPQRPIKLKILFSLFQAQLQFGFYFKSQTFTLFQFIWYNGNLANSISCER